MDTAENIAERIRQLLPDFRLPGSALFGHGLGDNWYTLTKAEAEGNCLVLTFDGQETFRVGDPAGYKIDENPGRSPGKLEITYATRLL
jgi:hypothetical protein